MNKVLLFAHLKERTGKSSLQVDASGKTVAELRTMLQDQLGSVESIMVAINEEFATEETVIEAGDEIAFIPPVSGG